MIRQNNRLSYTARSNPAMTAVVTGFDADGRVQFETFTGERHTGHGAYYPESFTAIYYLEWANDRYVPLPVTPTTSAVWDRTAGAWLTHSGEMQHFTPSDALFFGHAFSSTDVTPRISEYDRAHDRMAVRELTS